MLYQLNSIPLSSIVLSTGLLMIIVGLWGVFTKNNIIKMILSISIIDTGIHMILVSIGYLQGMTAPILDTAELKANAVNMVVDPIPSALVLTSIVIGLGVTALMLSYAIKLYREANSLLIEDYGVLKW